MSLNKIDFSDGIRPEEIQENFEMLQDQLNRERLNVGGLGIASGFDIETRVDTNIFQIRLSEASVIDEDGSELFIPACVIDIDPPELFNAYESCTINYNNQITLKQVPYAANRRMPAEYLVNKDPAYSSIYINYPSNNINTDDYIRVIDINGTVLTVTGAISRDVVVRYRYTADRIDTVYLNDKNEVCILKGTTSTTPSKAFMPADGKLLIAYIMIKSEYVDENITVPSAQIYVKDDMRSLRNLYTDSNNTLWICGVPFDDLQIVHMKEPKEPKENTLWLNTETNTLSYWKSTDGYIYTNKIVIDTDFVAEQNANRDFATYMDFLLGEHELEVYHSKAGGESNRLVEGVHYYELYNELPTVNQNVPSKAEGNSFRIIEDSISGNGLTLKAGDVITYMIKFKDSHFMWVPINKMSYVNAKEHKVYCTSEYMPDKKGGYFDSKIANRMTEDGVYPYKYQYFLFDRESDLRMHFTPGRHELSVYINQMILHEDQFEEITVHDLLETFENSENPDNKVPYQVVQTAAIYYGWTEQYLEEAALEYENSGIGFKLIDPLDSGLNAESHEYMEDDGSNDLYLEAVVERRVCGGPFKRKLQRSATFVKEKTVVVTDEIQVTNIINIEDDAYYRYNEHQLEVYLNGVKLSTYSQYNRDPELIEQYGFYLPSDTEGEADIIVEPIDGTIIDKDPQRFFEEKRSAVCEMFKINRRLNIGDIVTYKITTNVYSYSHLTNLYAELEIKLDGGAASINTMSQQLEDYKDTVNNQLAEMGQRIGELSSEILSVQNNGEINKIKESVAEIKNTIVTDLNHINTSFTYELSKKEYIINDIRQGDYLTVVRRDVQKNLDSFLIPNRDYFVYDVMGSSNTYKYSYIEFAEETIANWQHNDIVFITGIKFGKAGR